MKGNDLIKYSTVTLISGATVAPPRGIAVTYRWSMLECGREQLRL